MKVAITGASGYFGRKIIEKLNENDEIEKIIGMARREMKHSYKKLEYHRMDVRDEKIKEIFERVDAVIHLAFVLNPIHDMAEMHSINVDGARNVLQAARRVGVGKVIMTSSTMVYGAWEDNPKWLTEESPLRGHPTYYYNRDKIKIEKMCGEFSDLFITILRPCLVLGRSVDHFYSRLLNWKFLPLVDGRNPEMQFIHEDDIARAYEHFLMRDFRGAFNIVGKGTMKWKDVIETAGIRAIGIPSFILRPAISFLWKARLIETPPEILDFIKYRWVASGEKAKKVGFEAKYTTYEALMDFLRRA